jgi:hypothetical protein
MSATHIKKRFALFFEEGRVILQLRIFENDILMYVFQFDPLSFLRNSKLFFKSPHFF